jgi:hypothetical protein
MFLVISFSRGSWPVLLASFQSSWYSSGHKPTAFAKRNAKPAYY